MRRLGLLAALTSLACALCLADGGAPTPSAGPGADLIKTACSSGLLLRHQGVEGSDADGADADVDDGFDADADGDSGLFGSSDDGDKAKADRPKPKKKPKTRLLRPRSDADKDACPAKVKDLYEKYGDRLDAVPAPENVPTDQIEANVDRVFEATSGPAKAQTLATLKDGDIAAKSAVVDKLFDGVATLNAAAFETVDHHAQALASSRTGAVLRAGLETTPAGPSGASGPSGPAGPSARTAPAPVREASGPPPDDNIYSGDRRRALTRVNPVPLPGGGVAATGYVPPPVGTSLPQGPPAASLYNRYTPDFIQSAAVSAGSWVADKVFGGGNPAVDVKMPADTQSPARWKSVRFGNYGTDEMIKGLVAVGGDMGKLHSPTLQLGDISQKGGGTFRRHLSHKIGKDVDIFFITDKSGHFDAPWNLTLAATAVKDMNVTHIFCDTPLKGAMTRYLAAHPEIPADARGQMRKALSKMSYWPGHDTHFHIRIDY